MVETHKSFSGNIVLHWDSNRSAQSLKLCESGMIEKSKIEFFR
nr:hypothetical protein [uncultured bacterium]